MTYNRRRFIKVSAIASTGLTVAGLFSPLLAKVPANGRRVGIIGLDTSHAVAFTKTLNAAGSEGEYLGYKVVAAYPKGSIDIKTSADRIPGYTEDVKKMGVEIVGSVAELLKKVDVVLLETNDGRLHLEQALEVIKAGKRFFIDKPVAASLKDAVEIFGTAEKYKVPVFSTSSLRYIDGADEILAGKIGKIVGAHSYSPAVLEPTHPDLFWYGIHGVEMLFTMMGTGCKNVTRVSTADTDIVTGIWDDGRTGTFRGTRSGKKDYGITVFGERGTVTLSQFKGYDPLLKQIIRFFETGIVPVTPKETLEIYAFMEAADRSKNAGGVSTALQSITKY